MSTVRPSSSLDSDRTGPSIDCKFVSVRFTDKATQSRRTILDQLSMEVAGGDVVALLGKSGCGKSTLLRSIAGLQAIDAGEIAIDRRSIDETREMLAFVFQEPALLPWRTAIENVCLPLELRATEERISCREQGRKLLSQIGFAASDENKLPSQLSGGMKMRVSLARALVTDPTLLLLDEPFAALDDMLRWRLNEMLLELCRQRSRTVLFVTHNIAEAIFLSRHIAIMDRGHIARWIENPLPLARTAELRATPEFAQFYGHVSQSLSV